MTTIRSFLSEKWRWPVGLRLVRAGPYYFAFDTGNPADHSEWAHQILVLNDSLTKVLWPTR